MGRRGPAARRRRAPSSGSTSASTSSSSRSADFLNELERELGRLAGTQRGAVSTTGGPYVGLDYFVEEDAGLFFGRDGERKRIIGNLRASRLTLLYAESGVGKSSLLRAGCRGADPRARRAQVARRLGAATSRSSSARGAATRPPA